MAPGSPGSRVSRETRLLLLTLLLSVIALLVLARIRFPERPATPALVPPLLTQLAPATPFEDLSNAVSTLEAEVTPSLQLLESGPATGPSRVVPALRLGPYAAVALVGSDTVDAEVIARDRATGLAVVRTPASRAPERRLWTPQRVEYPRYLLVTEASPSGVSLRPVFVGKLRPATSYAWETTVWALPRHLDLPPGAFVFTTTGLLAGLVADEPPSLALVPAEAVMSAAERLLTSEQTVAGTLGIEVQAITRPIASALGVSAGVVVVHVVADGPAADHLVPTDVIEAVDDQPIANPYHWNARLARLAAGQTLSLRVRRSASTVDVKLTAADASKAPAEPRLGLALRSRPGLGAEVRLVSRDSIAERAGIKAGDLITRAGDVPAPTPAQVTRAFEALPSKAALLVAITRGEQHLVVALARP